MRQELKRGFNEKVEKYRRVLVDYAKRCEWDAFKAKAGELFDYVEGVEISETERRFRTTFMFVLTLLLVITVGVLKAYMEAPPELLRIRRLIVISAVGGGSFEFYFFLNFRLYMVCKRAYYRKRRERFIRNIERDFRTASVPAKA